MSWPLIKSLAVSLGRIFLVLIAPMMLAALSTIPNSAAPSNPRDSGSCMDSNFGFCAIERLVDRDPNWVVIGRSYHPRNPDWSLVLWCDSSRQSGTIEQDELLVLEHQRVSRSIMATRRLPGAGPAAPLRTDADTGAGFARRLRGDLAFRSVVVGRTDQLEILALVNQMLETMVREVEEPEVSLTSAHF